MFDARNQSRTDARHEDALARIGGGRDELGGATRHPGEVAGAGQCHQDRPLTKVMPQGQPVEVAGDMVEIGVGPVYGLLDAHLSGVRCGRPQGEPDTHGKNGHQLMVGAVRRDRPGVA